MEKGLAFPNYNFRSSIYPLITDFTFQQPTILFYNNIPRLRVLVSIFATVLLKILMSPSSSRWIFFRRLSHVCPMISLVCIADILGLPTENP